MVVVVISLESEDDDGGGGGGGSDGDGYVAVNWWAIDWKFGCLQLLLSMTGVLSTSLVRNAGTLLVLALADGPCCAGRGGNKGQGQCAGWDEVL